MRGSKHSSRFLTGKFHLISEWVIETFRNYKKLKPFCVVNTEIITTNYHLFHSSA
jgi:hypothetical protein